MINIFNKLSKISDEEEREFKKRWFVQLLLNKFFDMYCMKCPLKNYCFTDGAIIHIEQILRVCNYNDIIETVRLFKQTKPIAWDLGNDNHNKWHDELKEIVK